jgi:hypothetical protein
MSDQIRVIAYKVGEKWLAQGLERAISAQADTLDALYIRFRATVKMEAEAFGGLDHIPQAPKRFFEMWERKVSKAGPIGDDTFDYRMVA